MSVPSVRRRMWTRATFDRLVEVGAFREDDCVELLDGEIWEMSPPGSRHVAGATVTPLHAPNAVIAVSDLLP